MNDQVVTLSFGRAPAAFEHLLDEMSTLTGLDKTAARIEMPGVIVYGMDIWGTTVCLTCPQGNNHTYFSALVDAGPAPELDRLDRWRALMEANFALASNPNDACFCCDEARERLQLRFSFPLCNVSAARLMTAIRDGVQTARLWRATVADTVAQPA